MQQLERRIGGQVAMKLEKQFRGGEPPNWGSGPGNRREPYLKRNSNLLVLKSLVGRGTVQRGAEGRGQRHGAGPSKG